MGTFAATFAEALNVKPLNPNSKTPPNEVVVVAALIDLLASLFVMARGLEDDVFLCQWPPKPTSLGFRSMSSVYKS